MSFIAMGQTAPDSEKASVMAEAQGSLYPGMISGGIKANDAYVDGNFSIVAPVWSTLGADGTLSGDVIFIEPYVSWGEQDETAMSIGLGWRHLFGNQSVKMLTEHDGHQAGLLEEGIMIGANVFVDLLDTRDLNRFWQLGVGAEVETRYFALRGNYYIPLSDRELVEEIRTSQSFTNNFTKTTFEEPFATGYSIMQDVTRTSFQTTTTIERLFRRFEEGMEGWDAEIALLIPGLDRYVDLRVIGGYYSFDNQPFGPQDGGTGDVEGFKVGVEFRPVPAVVLTGTWYEDERLTGSDWVVGAQLQIPFEAGDLGDGKGLRDRVADAFRPRRRHLAERIAEPVRRQNVAIKIANNIEEDRSATTVHRVTRLVKRERNRIVLADTVVFVDNAIGAPGNPGTYELPLNTIQGGEIRSGAIFGNAGIVFVQGSGAVYAEDVTVSQSTAFYGSGRGFPALAGHAFHGRNTITPVMTPAGTAFTAINIGAMTVSGFAIQGGNLGIFTSGLGSVQLVGNSFSNQVTNSINLNWTVGTSGTAYISENVFSSSASGIVLFTEPGAALTATIVNNVITNESGIGIQLGNNNGRIDATIEGNTILQTGLDGIRVMTLGGPVNIHINGGVSNTIEGVGLNGPGVRYTGGALGQFIINNVIVNSFPAFP